MSTRLRTRLGSLWALLLAGPVIGTLYFLVVYLFGEATCAEGVELISTTALRIVIIAGAVASLGVFAVYAWIAARRWTPDAPATTDDRSAAAQRSDNERFMVTTGVTLLGLFTLFVLFLAAPALGPSLC